MKMVGSVCKIDFSLREWRVTNIKSLAGNINNINI